MLQLLRSWRHAFSLTLSERLRASRGPYQEPPAGLLSHPEPVVQERADVLADAYGVRFEQSLGEETALRNYEYLDLLDRAFAAAAVPPPRPQVLCDAGCASFWYAAALAAFFRPARLIGVDVEGYRRLRGGHTRDDYARGYLASLGQGEFVVADYRSLAQPADLITSFFPFVTVPAILAWRLPTSLLDPIGYFRQVRRNMSQAGIFVMVNHGTAEAAIAGEHCAAAEFSCFQRMDEPGVFSAHRSRPAVVTLWRGA